MAHSGYHEGEVVEWDDAKRCGFVLPKGARSSEDVVFLGERSMKDRSRLPQMGDLVIYRVEKVTPRPGKRLRTNLRAVQASYRGDALAVPDSEATLRRFVALGVVQYLVLAGAAAFRREALFVLLVSLVLSAFALVQHAWDKRAASRADRRIPESSLHMVSLLGGWPGAALAQKLLRHKTRKASFRTTFTIVVTINFVVVLAMSGWLILSAVAS